ncbi:MAG: hypothetical protein WKF35_05240 [Ferruginibacter sp.]
MKYLSYTLTVLLFPLMTFCQDITGLWKGNMTDDSTKTSLEYEVHISKENGKYIGFSHTWFLINEKKYYGIKKIKVSIAKDGKIILQDMKLIDNNYPLLPYKDVRQLNVLDLANQGGDAVLEGLFVTNQTTNYKELSGLVRVKKINTSGDSDLMIYLQKNNGDNNLTAVK